MIPPFLNPAIINLKAIIQNTSCDINAAPSDTETLASQLKEWLSVQPHAAYDVITLSEIFGVSNRTINGSMTVLLRKGTVEYEIIDGIKYYCYRKG